MAKPKLLPSNSQLPYWLLIVSLISALVLRRVLAEGMFLDGVIYAVLSRNLAEGVGSTWAPYFSETLFPVFSEHPPFAFWLQSAAFRMFGDSLYVEKFYSLGTLVVTTGLIAAIWARLVSDVPRLKQITWLPVLLWLSVGSIPWAYANNLLENTLAIFTTLAIYLVVVACQSEARRYQLILSVGAGLAVCAAFLTKGPTGFFPLAAFGCYWLATRKIRFGASLLLTAVIVATVAAFYFVLFLFPHPREALLRYLDVQLLASLGGHRGVVGGFAKFRTFLGAVGIPALVASLILIAGRLKAVRPATGEIRRKALFLALVALSGSLPIFLSPKVTGLYLNPSIPFFALAFALMAGPVVAEWESTISGRGRRYLLVASAVVLFVSLGYAATGLGTVGRDRELLTEIKNIASVAHLRSPADHWSVAPICPEDWEYWEVHAYMARYYKTSLTSIDTSNNNFVIQKICP